MDSYSYEYGDYSPAPSGPGSFSPSPSGLALRTTVVHGTASSPQGVPFKTTKDVSVDDQFGDQVLSESYVFDGSSYSRISWSASYYDGMHHILRSLSSNNSQSDYTWSCCNRQSSKDPSGVEYSYSYDLLKRLVSKTRIGYASQPGVTTSYTYNPAGYRLSETISSSALSLSSYTSYDNAGRITSSTDNSSLTTSFAYSDSGRTVTSTLPGGFTRIESKYLDGSIKSITGSSVIPEFHSYGVNPDGSSWHKVSYASPSSPRFVKTTKDILDRVISVQSPGSNASSLITSNSYDSRGNLIKSSSTR